MTFILTRSQPRRLLSIARLKSARSRWFSDSSSLTLIAQMCFGFSGRFWPTMRPLFQAGRSARMAGKFGVCMMDPPIHHALPQRQPDVDKTSYHMMLRCLRGRLGAHFAECCAPDECRVYVSLGGDLATHTPSVGGQIRVSLATDDLAVISAQL